MHNIFFDIETVPNQTGEALLQLQAAAAEAKAGIKAPSNYKDQVKIDEYIAEARARVDIEIHDHVLKTSFDGALGHIAVLGVAIDDKPPVGFFENSTEPHLHEAKVIRSFFKYLTDNYDPSREVRPVWIGHYINEFDLRFLFQRCVVLGIEPPPFIPFMARPWDDYVFDTMTRWAGVKGSVKLDKLARALGLPGKTGMDGSQVWPAIAAGRMLDVVDYCLNTDVVQVRDVWRRMTFKPIPTIDDSNPFPKAA